MLPGVTAGGGDRLRGSRPRVLRSAPFMLAIAMLTADCSRQPAQPSDCKEAGTESDASERAASADAEVDPDEEFVGPRQRRRIVWLPDAALPLPPSVGVEKVAVISGDVDARAVQRAIRERWWKMRFCYDDALQRNPKLKGKTVVRAVIGPGGVLSDVRNAGSDLPDKAMVACVVAAYSQLSYPSPDGGTATFISAFTFAPHIDVEQVFLTEPPVLLRTADGGIEWQPPRRDSGAPKAQPSPARQ